MAHSIIKVGVVVSTAVAVSMVGATPALAKPGGGKPIGPVKHLVAHASHPGNAYDVDASWDALASATKYVVKMTNSSGTQIDSGTVTSPSWSGATTLPAMQIVKVTVTPYKGTRKGHSASVSVTLPDFTAPNGSFSVVREAGNPSSPNVSLHRDSVSDDVTAANAVTQTVDWGDGSSVEPWSTADATLAHVFPSNKAVYHPTVTLTDGAGNQRAVTLTVAVADTLAPTGTFAVTSNHGFARWTQVGVGQSAIHDDLSADSDIVRTVDWGDGTSPEVWQPGQQKTHQYATGGTFSPTVQLTDEAGNVSAPLSAGQVTVVVDIAAPLTTLQVPASRRARVSSWTTLHGTADDGDGVGVRAVKVKAVQKRRTAWFAYKPATQRWIKAGATKRAALREAGVATVVPTVSGAWSARLVRLTRGQLFVQARGVDNVGNISGPVAASSRLTRR